MQDVQDLEQRIMLALARIRAASQPSGDMAQLTVENRHLSAEIETLRVQRQQDVAQIDGLIAELRPLLTQTHTE